MKIKKDTRKRLSGLIREYNSDATKQKMLDDLSSKLNYSPESIQRILDDKEGIPPELGQRIDELHEKEFQGKNGEKNRATLKNLRNMHSKKLNIHPEFDRQEDNLRQEKFGEKDKELTIGFIQNKIDDYEELKFSEKLLTPRDFNYGLYGLQDVPNIPEFGEQVTIIDCNNGKEYPTSIQKSQQSISTGLNIIWDSFRRREILKSGDAIGIALDPENNHRIYVDFEYKDREKWGNEKRKYPEEDNKKITKYEKYEAAIEKLIPWIKDQIENSKDGMIRMMTKDVAKELGPEFTSKSLTSIYWGLKSILPRLHNIMIDQDIHDKSGDKLLIMRYRTEEDMPPSSQGQYFDGEVLRVPSLMDLETLLKDKSVQKERLPKTAIRNIEHDPEKEMAISLEKRRYTPRNIYGAVRDNSFRDRILDVYKDMCAICGLQMNMVEACHIIPVGNGGTDEIINGIALCHNHHKSFDSGLLLVNEEYCIVLNHSKIDDIKGANVACGLDDFIKNSRIGEKIFLPDDSKFHPNINFLIKKRNTKNDA